MEPEAASLYYWHLPVEKYIDESKVSLAKFQAGTKYLVLDAGGTVIEWMFIYYMYINHFF